METLSLSDKEISRGSMYNLRVPDHLAEFIRGLHIPPRP